VRLMERMLRWRQNAKDDVYVCVVPRDRHGETEDMFQIELSVVVSGCGAGLIAAPVTLA